MGYKITLRGKKEIRRGDESIGDDGMLINEIVARAPGLERDDLQKLFVALRMEFGEDALYAIRNGHVKFEERPAGERTAIEEGDQ